MNKLYNPFNYGVTWLGILRLAIAVYAAYWIYRILSADESVILKIFLILVCLVGIYACLIEGLPNIKSGIRKAKSHSSDFIIGRLPKDDE